MVDRRVWTAAVFVVLAFAAAAIGLARSSRPTSPIGDMAVIESYTLEAAHGRLLYGPYSRFQWHHPGPIYFYAMAPFYTVSGERTAGLSAAAAVLNVSMIVVAAVVAGAVAGPLFAAILAGSLTLYVLRVPDLLTSAWNPHIVVLPSIVAVLACSAAVAGRGWMLPLAALAASLAAETHVGTVPTLAVLGAAAFAAVAATRRPGATRRAPIAATVLVTLLAWLPSIIEQASHHPGNIASLWRFFAAGHGAGQPFRTAFLAWANMLAGVTRPDFYLAHGWTLRVGRNAAVQAAAIGQLVLLLAAALSALARRRRFDVSLNVCLIVASLVALWSVTRIEGDLMDHEIFWISGLGALNIAAVAYAAVPFVSASRRVAAPAAAIAALLVVVCCGAAVVRLADLRSSASGPEAAGIEHAAVAVREYLAENGIERPMIDVDQGSWNLAAGVLLQLRKAGVDYAVADDWLPMFTPAARADGSERVVLSVAGRARHVVVRDRPGVVTVVESDPVFVDAYGLRTNR